MALESQLAQAKAVKETSMEKMNQIVDRLSQAKTDRDILTKKIMQLEAREAELECAKRDAEARLGEEKNRLMLRIQSLENQLASAKKLIDAPSTSVAASDLKWLSDENSVLASKVRDLEEKLTAASSGRAHDAEKVALEKKLKLLEVQLDQAKVDRQVIVKKLLACEDQLSRSQGAGQINLAEQVAHLKAEKDAYLRKIMVLEDNFPQDASPVSPSSTILKLETALSRLEAERNEAQRRCKEFELKLFEIQGQKPGASPDDSKRLEHLPKLTSEVKKLEDIVASSKAKVEELISLAQRDQIGSSNPITIGDSLPSLRTLLEKLEESEIPKFGIALSIRELAQSVEELQRDRQNASRQVFNIKNLLAKQVVDLENECAKLKAANTELQKDLVDGPVALIRKLLASMPLDVDRSRAEAILRELDGAAAALRARHSTDLWSLHENLRRRFEDVERQLVAAKVEKDSWEDKYKALEAQLEAYRDGVPGQMLREDVEKDVLVTVLVKELKKKDAAIEQLQSNRGSPGAGSSFDGKAKELEDQVRQLRREKDFLTQQMQQLPRGGLATPAQNEMRVRELESKNAQLERKIADLERDRHTGEGRSAIPSFSAETMAGELRSKDMESKVRLLEDKLREMRTKETEGEFKNRDLESRSHMLEKRVKDVEEKRNALEGVNRELESKVRSLEARGRETEDKLREGESALGAALKDKEVLKEALNKKISAGGGVDLGAVQALQARNKELEAMLRERSKAAVSPRAADMEIELQGAVKREKQLREEVEGLRKKVEEVEHLLREMEGRVREAEGGLEEKERELVEVRRKSEVLRDLGREESGGEENRRELEEKLKGAEEKLREAESGLQDIEGRLKEAEKSMEAKERELQEVRSREDGKRVEGEMEGESMRKELGDKKITALEGQMQSLQWKADDLERERQKQEARAAKSATALEEQSLKFDQERDALQTKLRDVEGELRRAQARATERIGPAESAMVQAATKPKGVGVKKAPTPSQSDFAAIAEHARYLGMDPVNDSSLLWIAEEALAAPLPEPWSEHEDSSGRVYFYNNATDESSWEHPLDEYFRFLYLQLKLKARDSPDGSDVQSAVTFAHPASEGAARATPSMRAGRPMSPDERALARGAAPPAYRPSGRTSAARLAGQEGSRPASSAQNQ